MDNSEVIEYLRANKILIYLEGLIGAGKSSLCRSFNRVLNKHQVKNAWYAESIEKSLRQLFYSDVPRYAFSFQSIVIRDRIHTNEDAIKILLDDANFAIIDRSRYGDCSFALMHYAAGNISPKELAVYHDLIKSDRLDKYDVEDIKEYVVYLDRSPCKAREHVIERGNPEEIEGCTEEYLTALDNSYYKVLSQETEDPLEQEVISTIHRSQVKGCIVIDYEEDLLLEDGYLTEDQVFTILKKIIEAIKK